MITRTCAALIGVLLTFAVRAEPGGANPAAALHARLAELGGQLASNQFRLPLHLESVETGSELRGSMHALIERPFAQVSASLSRAGQWCDVMILHLNTKHCRAATGLAGSTLTVHVGSKGEQPLADAYPVEFAYRLVAATPEYFAVQLLAETGPLGTHDYRITLEAVPVQGGSTFLNLRYSYGFGFSSRVAMKAYLATIGADKVGFSAAGKLPGGGADFIGGMRGVIERNTMRYYLAIDTFLAAPGAGQAEKRLQAWFDATEQFHRQLHEVDRDEYLAMKRREIARQRAAGA